MIKRFLLLIGLGLLPFSGTLAQTQITPETTINIVVPRNPGGLQDMAARFVQFGLEKQGYNTVVLNRPGGADTIALRHLMDSTNTPEDVYLFSMSHSNVYHPYIFEKALYDVATTVKPVLYLGEMGLAYFVPKRYNVTTIEELQAFVQDNDVVLGSSAVGSSGHLLSLATFNDTIDRVTFSFYKSDSENMAAAIRGDLTFTLLSISLAEAMGEKLEDFVRIDLEYPVPIWQGLVAGPEMSDADAQELNRILNEVVTDSEVKAKFTDVNEPEPEGGSIEHFNDVITRSIAAGEKLSTMVKIQ